MFDPNDADPINEPHRLASIRDAFSRKVVAWETSGVADAHLEYALHSRRPADDAGLIHHADHGCQYTSIKLTNRLVKAGNRASMGTVGDSSDNALAENLWSAIKTECVRHHPERFTTRAEANQALFEYLDGFYNPRRIQKGLGWRSPDEFEDAHGASELTEADYQRLADLATRRRQRRTARDEGQHAPATTASAANEAPIPGHDGRAPGHTPAPRPGNHPRPRAGAAERVRPSGRTLTRTEKTRSAG